MGPHPTSSSSSSTTPVGPTSGRSARPAYQTPNVERLASQGCRFHNFYVPQAICSASRSALLSGCYPGRTKVFGAHPPRARGLDPSSPPWAKSCKAAGYRTAVFGKWHIGDQPETRPPARGFDESCGLMYSNDMWEFHPENPRALPQVSAPVLGERQNQDRARDARAPADADHVVHRARRRFHSPQQERIRFCSMFRIRCRTFRCSAARSSRASPVRECTATS